MKSAQQKIEIAKQLSERLASADGRAVLGPAAVAGRSAGGGWQIDEQWASSVVPRKAPRSR